VGFQDQENRWLVKYEQLQGNSSREGCRKQVFNTLPGSLQLYPRCLYK